MELFETIAKRHSYRGPFKATTVPRTDLKRIVEAGLLAPSGTNAQTTRFVIVDDPSLVGAINRMHPRNIAMQQAKAYIVCILDRQPQAVYEGYSFQPEDCAAAVENMWLALTALGYASVWVDGWLRIQGHAGEIGALLKIPAHKVARIIMPIGIPAEQPLAKEKKPFEERACFNQYEEQA
jgi:nitroreductase